MAARSGLNLNNSTMQGHLGYEKPGTIKPWPSNVYPPGWIELNGTPVSRALYPNLFGIYGTTYGAGDGSTTFGIPNLKGRVPVGAGTYTDPVSGSVTRILGTSNGAEKHLLLSTESALFRHSHVISGVSTTDNGHQHYGVNNSLSPAYLDPYSSPNQNSPLAMHYSNFADWWAYSIRGHESAADRGASSSSSTHAHPVGGSLTSSTAADAGYAHNNMQPYLVQRWIVKV